MMMSVRFTGSFYARDLTRRGISRDCVIANIRRMFGLFPGREHAPYPMDWGN
jgi:hypothetical protein